MRMKNTMAVVFSVDNLHTGRKGAIGGEIFGQAVEMGSWASRMARHAGVPILPAFVGERDGAFYLFTLRLIPAVPFFVINLVMGLTPMKAVTFWWVSQIGMLPGTMVYVYAGSRVPNLTVLANEKAGAVFSPTQLLQLAIAFGLLGIFPLLTKKVIERVAAARGRTDELPSRQ